MEFTSKARQANSTLRSKLSHHVPNRLSNAERNSVRSILRSTGVQAKLAEESSRDNILTSDQIHAVADRGTSDGRGPLPFMDRIQSSFGGYDVSGIQAFTGNSASEACKEMGADAFAKGNRIAFRNSPSLEITAHEAAHVVQQRAGVSLQNDIGQEGDVYEKHADEVANAVIHGRSAESILDKSVGRRVATQGGNPLQQRKAVQRKPFSGTTESWPPGMSRFGTPHLKTGSLFDEMSGNMWKVLGGFAYKWTPDYLRLTIGEKVEKAAASFRGGASRQVNFEAVNSEGFNTKIKGYVVFQLGNRKNVDKKTQNTVVTRNSADSGTDTASHTHAATVSGSITPSVSSTAKAGVDVDGVSAEQSNTSGATATIGFSNTTTDVNTNSNTSQQGVAGQLNAVSQEQEAVIVGRYAFTGSMESDLSDAWTLGMTAVWKEGANAIVGTRWARGMADCGEVRFIEDVRLR